MPELSDDLAGPYLEELRATKRPILRRTCLQKLCNLLPPADLTRLYLALPEIGGAELCQMAPEYKLMTSRRARKQLDLPGFSLEQPSEGMVIYRRGDIPKQQKRLFIFFSGGSGQFFLPFSSILMYLPPGPTDVITIRSERNSFRREGVKGLGQSQYEIVQGLKAKYETDAYRHVMVLGISAGGFYATAIAELIGANSALSLAGSFPFEARFLKDNKGELIQAFNPICSCRSNNETFLLNMSGAKNSHDENSKRQLKAVRPSLVNYYLIFSSNHNVLGPIRRHRLLVPFFWMFFNERTIPIRVVAALLRPLALFVVTARWLVGKKEKEWTSEVRERLLREQIAEDRGSDQPK